MNNNTSRNRRLIITKNLILVLVMLVIIFLASFFVFVFIAFCKNAVANIKADPQSNKLITDAWNAGKKS